MNALSMNKRPYSSILPMHQPTRTLDWPNRGLSMAHTAGRILLAVKDALFFSQRAIELDADLAEGYSSIGLISWALQYDFAKARIYFEKSIELNPASSLILNRYGYFLIWMGNFEKASQLAKDAMRLDPVDYNSYAILYFVSIYSGRLVEAAGHLKEWKRIFGKDRGTVSLEMRLSFEQGSYEKVVQLCDSLRAKRRIIKRR